MCRILVLSCWKLAVLEFRGRRLRRGEVPAGNGGAGCVRCRPVRLAAWPRGKKQSEPAPLARAKGTIEFPYLGNSKEFLISPCPRSACLQRSGHRAFQIRSEIKPQACKRHSAKPPLSWGAGHRHRSAVCPLTLERTTKVTAVLRSPQCRPPAPAGDRPPSLMWRPGSLCLQLCPVRRRQRGPSEPSGKNCSCGC